MYFTIVGYSIASGLISVQSRAGLFFSSAHSLIILIFDDRLHLGQLFLKMVVVATNLVYLF